MDFKSIKGSVLLVVSFFLLALSAQSQGVEVTFKRNKDNSVDFYYKKTLAGSYYLTIEFKELINAYSRDYKKVITSSGGRLFRLRPTNSKRGIELSYTYKFTRGNPKPRIKKEFTYILPFKEGENITIQETKNIKEVFFNAEKDPNWKSFLVGTKMADTIFCMRKGIVIEVVNEYKSDTLIRYEYTSKMNRVLVEHKDGSVAQYSGFDKNEIFVKVGQTVYPQTKLGVLGMFSNATYRLYFSVFYVHLKKDKMSLIHLNPYFDTEEGSVALIHGKNYKVKANEKVVLKEFTRREKRKYKKHKGFK